MTIRELGRVTNFSPITLRKMYFELYPDEYYDYNYIDMSDDVAEVMKRHIEQYKNSITTKMIAEETGKSKAMVAYVTKRLFPDLPQRGKYNRLTREQADKVIYDIKYRGGRK